MIYERNRQSELLIDVNAMIYNYNQIKKRCTNKKVLPVLKASGYGIGAKNVKEFLDRTNIDIIGTAFVDEGLVLRVGLGYQKEIVTINQPMYEDIPNIVKYGITVGVCYIEFIKKLNLEAKKHNKIVNIHIEIETGMGRTGVQIEKLDDFLKEIKNLNNVNIEGVYTHFATSDSDIEYMNTQIEIFKKAVNKIKKEFKQIKYIHMCNSAGTIELNTNFDNMVRPGIMIYGYLPDENLKGKIDLRPACILKSKISFIKQVEKDTSISYGRTFITKRKSIIANVPIGYADGIKRTLSNKGNVVINGEKAPIVGTICMDSFMIDVTDIPNVKIGDDVYIWDNKLITLEEVAEKCQTINYEILCTISNRVIRKIIE